MFFRPSIALPGAFLRLKREELSEVTQLFPFLLRSRFVPAATDTPPSSASRLSRPRHSCPPSLFRAHFLLPLSCRRASFPSVTGAQPRQLPFVHSSPDCVLRVFFCLPRVLSSLRQKRPSHGNASFSRGLVFPSLPCVRIPRIPSPAPHLLCIPRRKRRQHPACPRPAASPYAKGPPA